MSLDQFDLVEEGTLPTGNGDDRVGLFKSGSLIEVYGKLGIDGDGTAWEPEFFNYLSAWAYKQMGSWIAGGAGCTNGSTTTFNSSCPYPLSNPALSSRDFLKSELSIYPNPANGSVNIKTPLSGVKNIQLYDIMGRTVLNTKITSDVLDVSSVLSGLYLLRISIDDRSSTTKLIIE